MRQQTRYRLALSECAAGVVAMQIFCASAVLAEGAGSSPIMLAPGERLGVVDASQPGLQYEIVAPADRALALEGVLTTLGKSGISGAVNASRKSANAVVLDGAGRLQLTSTTPVAPAAAVASDQIVIKSGMIVLDRGKVSIYADQLPQPGKAVGVLQSLGVVNPTLTTIPQSLVNGLNPGQIVPSSGGLSLGSNSVPQVVSPSVSPAAPNYFAQVSINGVSLGTVNLNSLTIPANATNVTITSASGITLPNNFTVPGAASLTINSPLISAPGGISGGSSIALQSAPVILPGSAVLVPLVSSASTLSGGNLAGFQPGQIPAGGGMISGKGAVTLNGVGSLNMPGGITGALVKNPIGAPLISILPGK